MICGRHFSFITIASIGFLKWFTTDFVHFNACILPSIIRHILLYAVWYGVWFDPDLVIAHWITMNMPYHMPYPVWKCLPYRSTHPLYCVNLLVIVLGLSMSYAPSEKYLGPKQSPLVSHNDLKKDGAQLLLSYWLYYIRSNSRPYPYKRPPTIFWS